MNGVVYDVDVASNGSRTPRADAERNRVRILDQAAALIAEDPDASMVQIAEAAGVGRATLYRHFASREEVVDALRERAFSRAQHIIADGSPLLDEQDTPVARLRRLISDLFALADPYRLIVEQDPRHHDGAREAFEAMVLPMIREAQESGELTDDVSALAIGFALEGLMLSAIRGFTQGDFSAEEAEKVVQRGVLVGFAA
ncbi:MAG: TetR/AcrR family transcriptional regulator [Solirubrobacteraceae bacterium]|nr:TetR/AcrR family transcriptional regulator [Solirubrobacteraceae bacterium]